MLSDIHGPIVLGILGGLFGSFFINVNTRMSVFRKKYITTTTAKVIECGMYGLATMSVCVLFISFGELDGCQTPLHITKGTVGNDNEEINIHNL